MATKRQAPDEGESRQQQPWKRHKHGNDHSARPNHGKKSFKKAHPVNELKNTVRSVRRLLDRDNLPANIRVEKERELQTAQRELARAQRAKDRSEMIGKYHKIRFFERQKAERRFKKARKALDACEDGNAEETSRLQREVEEREVDVNYALNFPLDKDYVAMWPRRKKEGTEEWETTEERQGDREMWKLVRECMRKGTLADLREGRLTGEGAVEKEESAPAAKAVRSRAKGKKKEKYDGQGKKRARDEEDSEESDNESGGGFFE